MRTNTSTIKNPNNGGQLTTSLNDSSTSNAAAKIIETIKKLSSRENNQSASTISQANRQSVIKQLSDLNLSAEMIDGIKNKDLLFYNPDQAREVKASEMFKLFSDELKKFEQQNPSRIIAYLPHIMTVVKIYKYFFEGIFNLSKEAKSPDTFIKELAFGKDPKEDLVKLKNLHKLIINPLDEKYNVKRTQSADQIIDLPDINNRPKLTQSLDMQIGKKRKIESKKIELIKETIKFYFDILEKNILDAIFNDAQFVMSLLKLPPNDSLEIYKTFFVDRIISGFKSNNFKSYFVYFKNYVKKFANPNMLSYSQVEYLQDQLYKFIGENYYLSEHLAGPIASFFRMCADSVLLADRPKVIKKIEEFFLLDIDKESDINQIKNTQFERYQAEIAIKILNKICKDLRVIAHRGDNLDSNYKNLIKQINENSLRDSHNPKNMTPKSDVFKDKVEELKTFLNMIGYTKCMYHVVKILELDQTPQKNGADKVKSNELEPQENGVYIKYKKTLLITIASVNLPQLPQAAEKYNYMLPHPIVLDVYKVFYKVDKPPKPAIPPKPGKPAIPSKPGNPPKPGKLAIPPKPAIPDESPNQLDTLFTAILSQVTKINYDGLNALIKEKNNTQRPAETKFEQTLKSLKTELYNIEKIINSGGAAHKGGGTFYKNIIKSVSGKISGYNQPTLDKCIEDIIKNLIILKGLIEKFKPKWVVDPVDFSQVSEDQISAVLGDNLEDSQLFEGMQTKDIMDLVQDFSGDLAGKFKIYGLCVKMLKPIFEKNSKNNEDLVRDFDDEKNREKKKFFIENMQKLEAQNITEADTLTAIGVMLKAMIEKYKNSNSPKKYENLERFLRDFDARIEREKASYMYSLANVFKHYQFKQTHNDPTEQEQQAIADFVKQELESCGDASQGEKRLESYVEALQQVYPPIERYENNQIIAIYEAKKLIDSKAQQPEQKFFKVATGNGKTIIQATIAAMYIKKHADKENENKKVVIFTSFPHLAKRDQKAMQGFFQACLGNNGKSCYITEFKDLDNLNNDTRIIFADTESFITLGSQAVMHNYSDPKLKAFFQLAYGDWSKHLVLLDEFDVLLDICEPYRRIYDSYPLLKPGNSDLPDLSFLNEGVYQEINKFLGFDTIEEELKLKGEVTPSGEESNQTGNHTHTVTATIGAYFNKYKQIIALIPAFFSLKLMLKDAWVMGFSGSVDKDEDKVKDNYGHVFPSIDRSQVYEIPLFFAPDKPVNPNVVLRMLCFNEDQLKRNDGKSTFKDKLPGISKATQQAALSDDSQWLKCIYEDVQAALTRDQPVLIFVNEGLDNTDPGSKDLEKIKTYLNKELKTEIQVFKDDKNAEDQSLQLIANIGKVSLCTKKIGRGADIRVPISIKEGLHVIITRPDYEAEIIQEIGRTGRFNRKGSYSLIFKKDAKIPSYEKDWVKNSEISKMLSASIELSKKFYLTAYTQEQLKAFIWFQTILSDRFNQIDKSRQEIASLWKFYEDELK